jgi:MFS family permease
VTRQSKLVSPRSGRSGRLRDVPRTVWALGIVSMFMDVSSEMIHSVLPLFLTSVLGASAVFVGLIEGVAEAIALISRTLSGPLSDWLGKRKALAMAGYGLATLTKPLFAMANSIGLVFTARFLDRIGKGIRGAPRDALVADVTPPEIRGAAFGLRQSLDTVGALLGPLLAVVIMVATAASYRAVFWISVVPAILAVVILAVAVHERTDRPAGSQRRFVRYRDVLSLGPAYWMVVVFGFVFTLARFSEAFLLLRAGSVGVTASMIPFMMVLMNLVYSLTAYPVGRLSDRLGRTGLVAVGLVVLILADLVLASAVNAWHVAAGVGLWGLHLGLTQGLLSTMVADAAREDVRGTAFSLFSLAGGLAMLVASVTAGWLWEAFGAPATFFAGAAFAAAALTAYLSLRKRLEFGARVDTV